MMMMWQVFIRNRSTINQTVWESRKCVTKVIVSIYIIIGERKEWETHQKINKFNEKSGI